VPANPDAGPTRPDDVRPAPDDAPVRVPELRHWHVGLLAALAVGLVVLACAVGTLAALLVTDLVEVQWRPPGGDSGLVVDLWRTGR
jgi:hypothetical protein